MKCFHGIGRHVIKLLLLKLFKSKLIVLVSAVNLTEPRVILETSFQEYLVRGHLTSRYACERLY